MSTTTPILLLAHAAVTLLMTGVVLFVAVVHYPLMALVGQSTYVAYQAAHVARTTWVVAPLMLAEAALTGLVLLAAFTGGMPAPEGLTPDDLLSRRLVAPAVIGASLLAICWAVTFFLSVPRHAELASGFDGTVHAKLVSTNWIRTLAWCGRSAVAAWMVYLVIRTQ